MKSDELAVIVDFLAGVYMALILADNRFTYLNFE